MVLIEGDSAKRIVYYWQCKWCRFVPGTVDSEKGESDWICRALKTCGSADNETYVDKHGFCYKSEEKGKAEELKKLEAVKQADCYLCHTL